MAAPGLVLLPAGRAGGDLAAVGCPGEPGAGRGRSRPQSGRLVRPLQRDRDLARPAAGAGDDGLEPAAWLQPALEYLDLAAGHADDPGHAAGRPAGQPECAADAGI